MTMHLSDERQFIKMKGNLNSEKKKSFSKAAGNRVTALWPQNIYLQLCYPCKHKNHSV